ncbi:ATP-binding protein [Pseudonocardia kunmingensis]|nr:ATP-binding protein [Pseudonocardia kunmingensis]
MSDDVLLTSLLTAVDAVPDDVPLRLHVAALLADHGRAADALQHCSHALTRDPGNADALALLQRVTAAMAPPTTPLPVARPARPQPEPQRLRGFDWAQAEEEVAGIEEPLPAEADASTPVVEDVERPAVRLADVGGMQQVKERLELAFLGPMRNPQLAKAFGKSLSGGLLLYGPPGCGKTFLAKAVAGELGASFFSVGVSDVLDMYTGQSERNLARIFTEARRHAPCVLFFDELDALGQKRSHLSHSSSMRNTVNQMLTELDSVTADNEGVFVLGATNHPWDIDSALRRPGRFDRMVLVLPPDAAARTAVLRYHLRDRPVSDVNLDRIVKLTEHFSGADLAHVCTTAAERALALSMRDGRLHALTTKDLEAAVKEVRPSTGPWFATARNVVAFANTDGEYDDLSAYLRKNKKL